MSQIGHVRPAGQGPKPTGRGPVGAPDLPRPLTVGFLLIPDFSMIAFTAAIEPLRLANRVAGQALYAWRLYSVDGRPAVASNGVAVAVDGAHGEIGALPMLVVCSGVDVQKFDHRALAGRLRKLAASGSAIGAVCTGSHILARAGLLDGYHCTIHWENLPSFVEEFPELAVTQELFEIDRDRFTCAGGTAALDMMLSIIAAQCGRALAAEVTDQLIHHRIRGGGERQRMDLRTRLGVAHPKLLAVVARMEETMEEPLSCAALAAHVGLSTRQLERLFRKYLGQSPTRRYRDLRLDRARFLITQTSMPVIGVALACGFVSASHFTKCYSDHFGRTPSQERRGGA